MDNMGATVTADYLMPILGQVAYLSVALLATTAHYFQAFRWRTNTKSGVSYYENWTKLAMGTNYWEYANMINNYAGLGIWGIAFITQSLSFAGLLAEINVMTWTYLVGLIGTIIGVVYNVFYFLALWSLYGKN